MSSHQTLELHHVTVFRIPPGEASMSRWNTEPDNIVWKGGLRVLETESDVANMTGKEAMMNGMQLKIELFNHQRMTLFLEDFAEVDNDTPWAEVWYNPRDADSGYTIANDGSETVEVTQSSRIYRIVAQLPDSGYHPVLKLGGASKAGESRTSQQTHEHASKSASTASGSSPSGSANAESGTKTIGPSTGLSTLRSDDTGKLPGGRSPASPSSFSVLQVALGLQFNDKDSAEQFSEALATYRRRYRNFTDKYRYDAHLAMLQRRILADLRTEEVLREPTPSDADDDDFGNFVGASYD